MKQRFSIGQRVRIRLGKDVIAEDEINCDTGIVIAVKADFINTKYERINYRIQLDGLYLKKGKELFTNIGPRIWLCDDPETTNSSIEAI